MKKGFNASAKFPAVKEKSAAFTGSCLGGKLPRPSRAHPAVRRGPPAPALFVCSHFCHFSVRSRLRDVPRRSQTRRFPIPKNQERGPLRRRFPPDPAASSRLRDVPRRSQTRRFPISKSQERGPLRARFPPDPAGGKLPRPSRAHPAVRRGPPAPALFVCSHFCHFSVHSRLRDMPRRSQTRRFPISKSQGRGPLRARFPPDPAGGKLPRPSRAHPAAGQGPSCARAFRLRPFLSFPGPQPPA